MATNDPIISEVRDIRDRHAAKFNYDLKEIFRDIQAKQQASGRTYAKYPSRPVVTTTTATPNN